MNGDFFAGFFLGALITALAMTKSIRKGFMELVIGVYNRIFKSKKEEQYKRNRK